MWLTLDSISSSNKYTCMLNKKNKIQTGNWNQTHCLFIDIYIFTLETGNTKTQFMQTDWFLLAN